MKNISITIKENTFEFTTEILMRHLRKIQPLSLKLELWEIWELDFFVEMALILCESENKGNLENILDELNLKEVEKFSKDFEPVLKSLNDFNKKQEEDKKK